MSTPTAPFTLTQHTVLNRAYHTRILSTSRDGLGFCDLAAGACRTLGCCWGHELKNGTVSA